MITQDFRAGMQFYIHEARGQVEMPLVNKIYWAYKCKIVAQAPDDMEIGDLIMGKPVFRVMSAAGEYETLRSGSYGYASSKT